MAGARLAAGHCCHLGPRDVNHIQMAKFRPGAMLGPRGQLGRRRWAAFKVQHNVMHMGCVGFHCLNVQDAGLPWLAVQLSQQLPDPCSSCFSPAPPLRPDSGCQLFPPTALCLLGAPVFFILLLRAGFLWESLLILQNRRHGASLYIVVDVQNPSRALLQDAAGHGPALLRAGDQSQVHPVSHIPQLQLGGVEGW